MQVYNIEEGFRSYILLLVTSYHILSFRQVNGSRSGGDKCHRHTMYGLPGDIRLSKYLKGRTKSENQEVSSCSFNGFPITVIA